MSEKSWMTAIHPWLLLQREGRHKATVTGLLLQHSHPHQWISLDFFTAPLPPPPLLFTSHLNKSGNFIKCCVEIHYDVNVSHLQTNTSKSQVHSATLKALWAIWCGLHFSVLPTHTCEKRERSLLGRNARNVVLWACSIRRRSPAYSV